MLYNQKNYILKAIRLCTLSGMRTMSGPTFLINSLQQFPSPNISLSPLRFLQFDQTAKVVQLMAASKMASDKLPSIPARVHPLALTARIASGTLVGAAVFKTNKAPAIKGLMIGAITAAAATFGSYYLRRYLIKNLGLSSAVSGNVEDAFILSTGLALIKS